MRVMIRPSDSPHLPLDVTNSIVAAVARELSRVNLGEEERNWREAELLVDAMIGRSLVGPVDIEHHQPTRLTFLDPSYST